MHNGCAFGRRQRAVFARPLYARAVKRINTLLTPRNRRSGLFPRVFFFFILDASRNLPLFTHSFGKFVDALFRALHQSAGIERRVEKFHASPSPFLSFSHGSPRVYLSTRERRQ